MNAVYEKRAELIKEGKIKGLNESSIYHRVRIDYFERLLKAYGGLELGLNFIKTITELSYVKADAVVYGVNNENYDEILKAHDDQINEESSSESSESGDSSDS